MSSLCLKGAEVLLGQGPGARLERADVVVVDGRIAHVGANGPACERTLDLKGLVVLPGLIDTQVHFREPGIEHKEDLRTGSRGAAQGGVTGVFEMPNTKPATTDRSRLIEKLRRAAGRMHCHFAFYAGATPQNFAELPEMEKVEGCVGVKIFMGSSTGDLLVPDDDSLRLVLGNLGRRPAVHAEDEPRLRERRKIVEERPGQVRFHPEWRDVEACLRATQRVVRIALETGRPVHILHVSSAEEMAFLRTQPKPQVSVETLPQYLLLAAPECYERLGTLAQMNPPIRDQRHQDAIWRAVLDGTVDILGSDHAPHTREEKAGTYPNTPSGMAGVQTIVPLMLDQVNKGRLSLQRLVELMNQNPVRLFQIKNKGAIDVGYDADFTVVDMNRRWRITNDWIESKCGWTPFDELEIQGAPRFTIVGGHIAMQEGELTEAKGQPILFHH
jgi:dihydroorotase